jgi:hypothetical protein
MAILNNLDNNFYDLQNFLEEYSRAVFIKSVTSVT